jgi:putative hydrolase of HD superfamily
MNEQPVQALLALYSQIATLKLLPRTGWLQRGVASAESVAEHTFGVATLALLLADTVEGIDRGKLLAIALIHDLAEVSLGDLPASARRFLEGSVKHDAERRALDVLMAELPHRSDYIALWEEYRTGSSREARLVKGIDRLEMLFQALAYERSGNRGLAEFWVGADQGWCDEFPILRALALQLLAQRETR